MYCVDAKVGDRIELHPGTDLWMRGARFGTVLNKYVRHGLTRYRVQLDKLAKPVTVPSFNVQSVID